MNQKKIIGLFARTLNNDKKIISKLINNTPDEFSFIPENHSFLLDSLRLIAKLKSFSGQSENNDFDNSSSLNCFTEYANALAVFLEKDLSPFIFSSTDNNEKNFPEFERGFELLKSGFRWIIKFKIKKKFLPAANLTGIIRYTLFMLQNHNDSPAVPPFFNIDSFIDFTANNCDSLIIKKFFSLVLLYNIRIFAEEREYNIFMDNNYIFFFFRKKHFCLNAEQSLAKFLSSNFNIDFNFVFDEFVFFEAAK